VDHRLTRLAAEKLRRPLWYYADYPYVIRAEDPLKPFRREGWYSQVFPISEVGLVAWQEAVAAHHSQISTFWQDLDAMRQAIWAYRQSEGGIRLWKKSC
jgi:hypothetical protein